MEFRHWFIIAVLAGAAWHFFGHILPAGDVVALFQSGPGHGQRDQDGRTVVWIFRHPGCKLCDEFTDRLDRVGASYEVYLARDAKTNRPDRQVRQKHRELFGDDAKIFVNTPAIVTADAVIPAIRGGPGIRSFLVKHFGPDAMTRMENIALSKNFDDVGRPRIYMYATSWCGYCAQTRKYLRENNISFTEVNHETDADVALDFKALGCNGVPTVFIGNDVYGGLMDPDFKRVTAPFQRP